MKLRQLWQRRATRSAKRRGLLAPSSAASGPSFHYAPQRDGRPDPGEVVWAWVPYEDDPTQGKDRPVLLVAREGESLFGLYLTSKDHDRDAGQEARAGRFWMDIGTGGWDRQGRPSEVRLNRLISLDPASIRREGSAVSREVFEAVVRAAQPYLATGPRPQRRG